MDEKKALWAILILTGFLVVVGLSKDYLIDKLADRVIEKLQKPYSPSPYGPGVDPDKLDVISMDKKWNNP